MAASSKGPDWREALRAAGPLFGLGIQFAMIVSLCVFGGHWLEGRYGFEPWGTLIGGIIGIAIAFYHFFRAVLNRENDGKDENRDAHRNGR